MLQQFTRLVRTSCRKFLDVMRDPDTTQAWLTEVRKTTRVHDTIEFTGHQPDQTLITIGADGCIERDVSVWLSNDKGAVPRLIVGDRVFIGRNSTLGCYQPITIGDEVMIGANCYITAGNHCFDARDIPMNQQGFVGAPITIGCDVWIGTNVTILPGIIIGNGAIVGAGSVVNKSVPPHQIWAGVPARFIRNRPGGK